MKKILVVILIATTGYVAFRARDNSDDGGASLAFGRVWLDALPKKDTDMADLFVTVPQANKGAFSKASKWKGEFELFTYERGEGGRAELTFPQSREKEKVRLSARRCRERGFDLCLELKGSSRGVKRYYSMNDWVVRGTTLPASPELPISQLGAALSP